MSKNPFLCGPARRASSFGGPVRRSEAKAGAFGAEGLHAASVCYVHCNPGFPHIDFSRSLPYYILV